MKSLKHKRILIVAKALALMLAVSFLIQPSVIVPGATNKVTETTKKETEREENIDKNQVRLTSSKIILALPGSKKRLKLLNTKKFVTWSVIKGKKCISLFQNRRNSVSITAEKKGVATVQAMVGKKKYFCRVSVGEKNKQDVAALKKIIADQKAKNPDTAISEDLDNDQYFWED